MINAQLGGHDGFIIFNRAIGTVRHQVTLHPIVVNTAESHGTGKNLNRPLSVLVYLVYCPEVLSLVCHGSLGEAKRGV